MHVYTWKCHVCGRVRPDDKISVLSANVKMGTFEMQQNVRYCNDDPDCVEGAKDVDFLSKSKEY